MQNKIIVITAPSGSGKTSIVKYLLSKNENLMFSISAATRQPRNKEQDGVDYYFISSEDFKTKIENKEFVEWEMVYEGKYYGTLHSELNRIWSNNKYPLVDIDVKGAINIKEHYGENCLTIFVQPPSIEELKNRLIKRGTENEKTLNERIAKANYELSFKDKFDCSIINDDLEIAQEETMKLVNEFLG